MVGSCKHGNVISGIFLLGDQLLAAEYKDAPRSLLQEEAARNVSCKARTDYIPPVRITNRRLTPSGSNPITATASYIVRGLCILSRFALELFWERIRKINHMFWQTRTVQVGDI